MIATWRQAVIEIEQWSAVATEEELIRAAWCDFAVSCGDTDAYGELTRIAVRCAARLRANEAALAMALQP